MHLYQKQESLASFFFTFLKSTLNVQHLSKTMTPIAYILRNYGLRITCLDKSLKSPV